MAITIQSAPPTQWSPAFAPVAFTLVSDLSFRAQFSFVADVYVYPGGTQTFLGRLRAPAIGGVGLIDVGPLLASTLDPVPDLSAGFSRPEGWWGEFTVQFFEEYEEDDGIVVIDGSSGVDSGQLFHYAAATSEGDPVGGARMRFLLGQPRERTLDSNAVAINVRQEDRVSLMWLRPVDGLTPARAQVAAYGVSGGLLWNRVFALSPSFLSEPGVKAFGAGPAQINELARAEAEWFPPINASVDHYTVQLVTSAALPASEKVRFALDRRGWRRDAVRVHWMNASGGLDSASFRVSESESAERQRSWTGDYIVTGAPDYQRRAPRVGLRTTASASASADFESNAVTWRGYEALKGLARSPRVWVQYPKLPLLSLGSDAQGTRVSEESLRGVNPCDRDLTGTQWHWVIGGATPFEDSSSWTSPDYGLELGGGRLPFEGVPVGACLYEEGWDPSALVSVAPSQPRWTPSKDNLRLFSFSAELPPPPSQWR